MKKVACFIFLVVLLAGQTVYAENMKIGVVDLLKALNESDSGKKAKADLEFLIKLKQSSLEEKSKTIEKLKGDLDKQSSVLSSEARKSKEEELDRLVRELQRLASDSQAEVKKKENDFTVDIIKELRVIIEKVGAEEGYTMIIENADGIILFSKKDIDLTDVILKKYNASKAKDKK
jgi:outer membrane protein